MLKHPDKERTGVSSAISVVLIIAVVVALTSLVTVISFSVVDISPSENPQASFRLAEEGGEVQATIIRNENVDSFTLQNDENNISFGPDVGSKATLPLEKSTYFLKASTGSDGEQVLDKLNISSSDIDATTISGSVNINPSIPDAKVKIIDQDTGSITKEITTDSNGEFETPVPEGEYEVLVNATDIEIQIDGNTEDFYGGTWKQDISRGENVRIDFDRSNTVECQVNGKDGLVSFGEDSNGEHLVSNKYQTHCIDDLGIDGEYKLGRNIEDTTGNGLSDYRQREVLNTDPTVTDTNGDGLSDELEVQELGTDPLQETTVYDGFTDKQAYDRQDLDANRSNVLVQVSYMDSSEIDIGTVDFNEVEQKFANKGYNLEFDIDNSPVANDTGIGLYNEYTDNYYNDSSIYSRRSDGYLHMLIVNDITTSQDTNGDIRGVTSPDPNLLDGIMVEYSSGSEENKTEHFIMHEIGHQLGLVSSTSDNDDLTVDVGDAFSDIDSQSSSCSNYNSVMNYNCQPNADGNDFLSAGYSDPSSGRDDWSIVREYRNRTNPINTDEACFQPYVDCSS